MRTGAAGLSLLSEVATEQLLLVAVDDAQWLDRASAQSPAAVARRLMAVDYHLRKAFRKLG